ncbi:YheC/YheD family endospore coat-associated protein [Paenibacillus gansuensis]|uniref:YheC/YheD family protein n=1 Tax=Paenibacillus gansuensis TaxID=306542 RepID=A0ABW5PFX3_9BACL
MQSSKVTVQVLGSSIQDDLVIWIGDKLMKQHKLPAHQPVTLKFGAWKQQARVVPVPKGDGVRIQPDLARRMGLKAGTQLRIQYKATSHTLILGPVIAVLVSRSYPQFQDRPFGAITAFCKELTDACRSQGAFVYFFTPNELGSQSSTIQGWSYADHWFKAEFPAPDVLHNRLTTRKLENKPSVQHFMKEVKTRYRTSVFNEKFLNKTEVFQALQQEQNLQRYLPESYLFKNYAMLKSMCSKHPVVFLKPIRGSLGKGIIRITRMSDNSYQCHFTNVNGARKQNFPKLLNLFTAISGKMKANRYQIQQGLQLMEVAKRPVDFRALVQKNLEGQWELTSIVARIAGNQHFVSNLARGGTLSSVKEAVAKSNLSAQARNDLSGKMKRAALDIAAGIESQIPAHFGELGIDLAVDSYGRVWLLEVNSKPSKNDNTQMDDTKIRPSVRRMVQYARFLSGFVR